jgi:beta-lactam-binding protein with PASTA domain
MNWGKFVAAVAAVVSAVVLSGCGGGTTTAPSTVTVTSQPPVAAPTSTAPPVTSVTLPDVTGMNAELAREQLENLGLTEVEFASANPEYSVVVLARNWTVTGIEPVPGTTVKSDGTVILKVFKE